MADANPYQLDIGRLIGLNARVRIWTKDPAHCSTTEEKRAKSLATILACRFNSSRRTKTWPDELFRTGASWAGK